MTESPETPSLADRLDRFRLAVMADGERSIVMNPPVSDDDRTAAAARLRQLDRIREIHVPYDEEVEVWPHHDGHDERFPDCTVEDDCEGHYATIQVCRECGHDHDGESPVFRLWPCPTIRLLEDFDV